MLRVYRNFPECQTCAQGQPSSSSGAAAGPLAADKRSERRRHRNCGPMARGWRVRLAGAAARRGRAAPRRKRRGRAVKAPSRAAAAPGIPAARTPHPAGHGCAGPRQALREARLPWGGAGEAPRRGLPAALGL